MVDYLDSMIWSEENPLNANSKNVNIYCSESKQTCFKLKVNQILKKKYYHFLISIL
jgi:hypothetical protein